MSLLEAVRQAETTLAENGVPSPRIDAELLVGHVLGLSRTAIYANGRFVSLTEGERLAALVARRAEREPLAYVLGEWGFRRLSLQVDPRVLIPRPETEVVVERCLELLAGFEAPRVLDVGTGSGAIALSIADEHPGARVFAVDSSAPALAVARENVRRTGLEGRVELGESDLLGGVSGSFDLVVSNPPYVSPSERSGLEP
ncbi:MAG TPA: HemK/PrmC family methyltransferase, partial [Gaiellaceae bacterium]|nr:HemK/PrmC family methyltransferase [Gaiellaceae bacterium]